MSDITQPSNGTKSLVARFQSLQVFLRSSLASLFGAVPPSWHAASQPLIKEFPLFSNLPAELRLQIWGKALPGPRVIEIISGRNVELYIGQQQPPEVISFAQNQLLFDDAEFPWIPVETCTNQGPPALASVCQESRELVLKKYTFRGERVANFNTFIDPEADTIFLPRAPLSFPLPSCYEEWLATRVFTVEARAAIRSIAVNPPPHLPSSPWRKLFTYLRLFPNLDRITIILPPARPYEEVMRRRRKEIVLLDPVSLHNRATAAEWGAGARAFFQMETPALPSYDGRGFPYFEVKIIEGRDTYRG